MNNEKLYIAMEQLNTTKQNLKAWINQIEKIVEETKYDIKKTIESFENSLEWVSDELDTQIDHINETIDDIKNMKKQEAK